MQDGVVGAAAHPALEVDEVLTQAVRDTGAHIGVVYLLADDGQVLLMETETGLPAQIVKPWTRIWVSADVPASGAVREGRLIWVPDYQKLACRYPATAIALPYPFAAAAAPIQSDGEVWGSMVLLWPPSHPEELTLHERGTIERATRALGGIMEEATRAGLPPRAGGEPRVLRPSWALMPDVHRALASTGYLDRLRHGCVGLDLEGRLTFVSAGTAGVLGVDLTDRLGELFWRAVAWLKDPLFEDRFRAAAVSQEPTSCVVRHPDGRALHISLHPDSSGISLYITEAAADRPGPRPGEPVAGIVSQPRADVFYNLLHLAATLSRALNVQEIVDMVAGHVMPVFDAQALTIMTAEGGRLNVIGSHGYEPGLVERFDRLPLAAGAPAQHVVRTGEPAFFSDIEELHRMYPGAEVRDGMAAWAFLPLRTSDTVAGACVLAFGEPYPFTDETRASLTAMAGLIAQALDRALLYDAKDRLAHTLQTSLLPRSLPEIAGLDVAARYVAATRGVGIGGDFYDMIRLGHTKAAAIIGDVQGHNVTAAALMGQVRTAIHAYAAAGASPGDVLKLTNRLLMDLDPDLFTSCLLVYFDLRLRTLWAASAGHPPPLLRPPGQPAEVIDVPAGILLGVQGDAEYPTVQVPFPPDAVLLLYTDGLVETPGVDLGEAIGELAEHFGRAAGEPVHQLCDTLLNHAPHTSQRADDIALLLVEHRAPPG
ncbi:GAF domain-containing protein [Nonomuraea sp. KC401]|uniref:PP2C family protein-serine/threonine phosphatase n=1 Tax=unclassified Nonomuraea TaxID=2593643 RepID=UPI0010FE38BA|nr:GAF domain-containing SpoIIE family protein phosphatase [Nonomuraea sp. KC401]NBE94919.1 SpoIIE family protein phosphatase [Nonomuraea sp. K271]TLF74683.1 GAF domain-containing protein [Nonomuraea sp. KC401]